MSDLAVKSPAAPRRPAGPGPVGRVAGQAGTLVVRSIRLSLRNVESLLTALVLPVLLMLLFVYLFGGAIDTGTAYVMYVVPGVLVLCAGFGASMVAMSVSQDLGGGIIDRFRSMDVAGPLILLGHVTASVCRNLCSTALVLGVAVAAGFRTGAGPAHWLTAVGILVLFLFAISWLAAGIGALARTPEAANGVSFVFMFLPYASSAFVPIHTMPSWLRGFATHQPITPPKLCAAFSSGRRVVMRAPRSPGASAFSWPRSRSPATPSHAVQVAERRRHHPPRHHGAASGQQVLAHRPRIQRRVTSSVRKVPSERPQWSAGAGSPAPNPTSSDHCGAGGPGGSRPSHAPAAVGLFEVRERGTSCIAPLLLHRRLLHRRRGYHGLVSTSDPLAHRALRRRLCASDPHRRRCGAPRGDSDTA